MPSVGTVDSLQPIAAAPPNLREEICGRGRKHRTDHAEEEDQAGTQVDSASAAYAAMMPNFRAGPGALLLDLPPSMPPIPVSVVPVRGIKTGPDGAPEAPVKIARKKKGRQTAVIQVAAPEKPAAQQNAEAAKLKKQARPKVAAKPKPAASTATTEKPEPKKPAAAATKPKPAPAKKKPATTAAAPSAAKPQP
jgi:D-alanyl-D-alanine carboxypeptidase